MVTTWTLIKIFIYLYFFVSSILWLAWSFNKPEIIEDHPSWHVYVVGFGAFFGLVFIISFGIKELFETIDLFIGFTRLHVIISLLYSLITFWFLKQHREKSTRISELEKKLYAKDEATKDRESGNRS